MISYLVIASVAAFSATGETVLLDFSADWCGPCRMMEPTVRRLINSGYPVRKINIDHHQQLASRFRVHAVPCFVMVRQGREVDRIVGPTSYSRLVKMFPADSSPTKNQNVVRTQSPDRSRGIRIPTLGLGKSLRSRKNSETSTNDLNSQIKAPARFTQQASTSMPSPQKLAKEATVRLKIEDANGHSFGSGTIIDVHQDEALVLTCGHIFRDSRGKGRIIVDLFSQGKRSSVLGRMLSYDLDRDIGLVSIRPGVSVKPIQLAPESYRPQNGESVFSIGCDRGGMPNVRQSRISAVNKYLGSPNLVVAGQPVDGRSGGGLFSRDGRLIGVCNFADKSENEGIYAATATICRQLDQAELSYLHQREKMPVVPVSHITTEERKPSRLIQSLPEMGKEMPRSAAGVVQTANNESSRLDRREQKVLAFMKKPSRNEEMICLIRMFSGESEPDQTCMVSSHSVQTVSAADQRLLLNLAKQAANVELICIIRPLSGLSEKREHWVLERPTPKFLEELSKEVLYQNRNQQRFSKNTYSSESRSDRLSSTPFPTKTSRR